MKTQRLSASTRLSLATLFLGATAACAADASNDEASTGDQALDVRAITPIDATPHIAWSMAPRVPLAKAAFRIDRYGLESYGHDYVHPKDFQVNVWRTGLLVRATPGTTYRWTVRAMDHGATFVSIGTFQPAIPRTLTLPKGKHQLTLDARSPDGILSTATEVIEVKDVVIVAIGDSMGSGEGNPDVMRKWRLGRYEQPGPLSNQEPRVVYDGDTVDYNDPRLLSFAIPHVLEREAVWADTVCHRSFESGFAQAAKKYEAEHPHVSVTFLNYACSGARTPHLYAEHQKEEEGRKGSQLAYVSRELFDDEKGQYREVDHMLMSIGINDIRFADMMKACVAGNWSEDLFFDGCPNESAFLANLQKLDGNYGILGTQLKAHFGFVKNVWLMEYPGTALFQNATGAQEACENLTGTINPDGDIPTINSYLSEAEMEWLGTVAQRLVAKGRSAAAQHGWRYISGIDAAFQRRGYCAPNGQRYFNRNRESHLKQENQEGMFHPNDFGYAAMGNIVRDSLVTRDFLLTTAPRPGVTRP